MSKSTPFQTGSLESDARLVYVVDVNSGRHIRSLRYHHGAWHRYDG